MRQRLRAPFFLIGCITLTQIHDAYLWWLEADKGRLECGLGQSLFLAIALYLEAVKEERCGPFHQYRRAYQVFLGVWGVTFIYTHYFECVQFEGNWRYLNWGRFVPNLVVAIGLLTLETAFTLTPRMILTYLLTAWVFKYPGGPWCLTGIGLIAIDLLGEVTGLI